MIGESLTSAIMQKALDGTWQRQRAISNNIANHETPGYKSVKVSFEFALENELKRLQHGLNAKSEASKALEDIDDIQIRTYTDYSGEERADGNNVNLDSENIEMARTQLQYQYLTRAMTDMFARLRFAISEGKR